MYAITNLFHEFRTPNLIAKYHMVVLTLSDHVAKGFNENSEERESLV